MPVKKLKEFLDGENVRYVSIQHSLAYSSNQIAASAHVRGKELAKTVMVKVDGKMAMAVLPASSKVDLELLKETTGAGKIEMATEAEFSSAFPDCEPGAMPPFGNLYGMEVFAEESLRKDEEIAFNACSHTELIRLAYRDYESLVKPKIGKFSLSRVHA